MKASPGNIWSIPAYLPYLQPPLTTAMVTEAEARIGHKLPAEYLALLEIQNGGYIRFGLDGKAHDFIRGIGTNWPNIADFAWNLEERVAHAA